MEVVGFEIKEVGLLDVFVGEGVRITANKKSEDSGFTDFSVPCDFDSKT